MERNNIKCACKTRPIILWAFCLAVIYNMKLTSEKKQQAIFQDTHTFASIHFIFLFFTFRLFIIGCYLY